MPMMIGTAGWSIPAMFKPSFPEDGTGLERYGRMLAATEINSSFYRPHKFATYARWATSVPADFGFSVKLPKAISHGARLSGTEDLVAAFLSQIAGLGEKLHVVLVQLPPSLPFDAATADVFFGTLRGKLDGRVAIACEPRHPSWFTTDADQQLRDRRVARVAADPVLVPEGEKPGGWLGLHYRRLHGSPRVYYSPYEVDYLAELAATLKVEYVNGICSWCIFDNTASGAAISNAMALRQAAHNTGG